MKNKKMYRIIEMYKPELYTLSDIEDWLDERYAEGYELISANDNVYIFKWIESRDGDA